MWNGTACLACLQRQASTLIAYRVCVRDAIYTTDAVSGPCVKICFPFTKHLNNNNNTNNNNNLGIEQASCFDEENKTLSHHYTPTQKEEKTDGKKDKNQCPVNSKQAFKKNPKSRRKKKRSKINNTALPRSWGITASATQDRGSKKGKAVRVRKSRKKKNIRVRQIYTPIGNLNDYPSVSTQPISNHSIFEVRIRH